MSTHTDNHYAEMLLKNGYCIIPGYLTLEAVGLLERQTDTLVQQGQSIIQHITKNELSYEQFYTENRESLIAVPEYASPAMLCRIEAIAKHSAPLYNNVFLPIAETIKQLIGREICLFKDKCNLKNPGGGAFPSHQDIPAYKDFGPSIHVTAALFVDPSNSNNGALNIADNFLSINHKNIDTIDTTLGSWPAMPYYQSGPRNGEIIDEINQKFTWRELTCQAGDLILFNSYLPHKSATNYSKSNRRVFFITFNLASEGDHYERYYKVKRSEFGHPRFHIATPTTHNGL